MNPLFTVDNAPVFNGVQLREQLVNILMQQHDLKDRVIADLQAQIAGLQKQFVDMKSPAA